MRLFGRRYRLQVDDFRFEGLDVRFEVERTTKPSPNDAQITITNLSATHRKRLQEVQGSDGSVFVLLEAGYRDGIFEIFRGDLRDVFSTRQGTDWETTISSGDGERVFNRARLSLSLGPGATVAQVVKAIASSMGVAIEDATAAEVERLAFEATGAAEFGRGVALAGPAVDALEELLAGTGYEWSIQGGELRVVPIGKALPGEAVVLRAGTGLIGSPEPGRKITEARCLLMPGVEPGRQVRVESEHVAGAFRVERTKTKGDTKGQDWHHELDLQELSG